MTTQSLVQSKVYYGYGVAARNLGAPFKQYRAVTAMLPLSGTPIQILQAAFDTDSKFSFKAPYGYAKPVLFGLFDGSLVLVGDYFVHPTQGTFFAAGYEPIKPWLCVECNRTLSFNRPTAPTSPGYGAPVADAVLATGWPASVLQGTKGEGNPVGLPSDVRAPWVSILVPAIPGVTLKYSDRATDDLGRNFVLSNVELTDLGYRISATYAGA